MDSVVERISAVIKDIINPVSKWLNDNQRIKKYSKYICIAFGVHTIRNIFWYSYYKYYNYPPYISLGLPFLGNAILLGSNPEIFCSSVVSKNGKLPLTSVLLGYQTQIFVNNLKVAKQILKTQSIGANRPVFNNQFQHTPDFAFINGADWKNRRTFMQKAFGTLTQSSFIYKKVETLFNNSLYKHFDEEIIGKNSGIWYSSKYTNFVAMYTIMSIIFDNDDVCNLKDLDNISSDFYVNFLKGAKISVPSTAIFLLYSTLVDFKIPDSVMWSIFSARKLWLNQCAVMQRYLTENQILLPNGEWNKSHKHKSIMIHAICNAKEYTAAQLISDCHALLAAGMETTGKQLEFGLVILCQYPKVQQLVYQELVSVQNKKNHGKYHPKLLTQLHFLRAFVHEIIRYGIVSPFGLPHYCLDKDVKIGDYTIYKGCPVMINHLAIHHQQENGNEFDIYRWLDNDNKFNKEYKINNFMAFGYSSRDCIGQNIAMQELYSVFTLILNKYAVYNNGITNTKDIQRTWSVTRDIQPEIPIYLKHRK